MRSSGTLRLNCDNRILLIVVLITVAGASIVASSSSYFAAAKFAKFKDTSGTSGREPGGEYKPSPKVLVASADLEPSQVQDLGDIVPKLLDVKAKTNTPIKFAVRVELGDGEEVPSQEATDEVNKVLKDIKEDFQLG